MWNNLSIKLVILPSNLDCSGINDPWFEYVIVWRFSTFFSSSKIPVLILMDIQNNYYYFDLIFFLNLGIWVVWKEGFNERKK